MWNILLLVIILSVFALGYFLVVKLPRKDRRKKGKLRWNHRDIYGE